MISLARLPHAHVFPGNRQLTIKAIFIIILFFVIYALTPSKFHERASFFLCKGFVIITYYEPDIVVIHEVLIPYRERAI